MSWFKRKPKVKEPGRKVPRHRSPITEQHLKQVKEESKPTQKDSAR